MKEKDGEKVAGGERDREEEEKRRQKHQRRREEPGPDGKMKYEGWFSHKLPKATLLTVFLFEDERTLLR